MTNGYIYMNRWYAPIYPGAGGAPLWQGPWTGSDLYDADANYILDDNEIADLVADNIEMDPYIPRSDKNNINIDVRDGVVKLSGKVRDKRSKPLAYADAFWCDGVADVESNIELKSKNGQQKAKQKK